MVAEVVQASGSYPEVDWFESSAHHQRGFVMNLDFVDFWANYRETFRNTLGRLLTERNPPQNKLEKRQLIIDSEGQID